MQPAVAIAAACVAGALAAPTSMVERATTPFGPQNPVINSVCPAPHGASGPLPPLFPIADMLGSIIGPLLDQTIGHDTVEELDKAADQACVGAQQNNDGNGICQDTLAAVRAFVEATTPLGQAQQFGCLLDFICIAHAGPQDSGTCNQLLAISDCIANRIAGVDDVECN